MDRSALLKGTSTTKKTNSIGYLVNWDNILHTLLSRGIQIIITTIIFFLIWHIGKRLLAEYLLKNPKFREHMTGRKGTLAQLGVALFQYAALLFYLYSILTLMGVPVGTLLVSTGLVPLASGMGAQGLVSDIITGVNILNEGKYNIDDTIRIGNYTGTILSFTLRNACLEATNGAVIYILNRNIIVAENLSHDSHSGQSMGINLNLSVENNLTEINHAVDTINAALKDKFKKQIKEGPQIIGIINQTDSNITYQIYFQAIANSQSTIKNAYLSAYIKEFSQREFRFSSILTKRENSSVS